MFKKRRSFLERLTGSIALEDESDFEDLEESVDTLPQERGWQEVEETGDLAVDMHQTANEIVIHAMVAGVKPEDLDVSISRESVTISGKRSEQKQVVEENFFFRELSWGSFSRTIILPQEIEAEEAEAIERHGLLTLRLPKINKDKVQKLKVRIG